MLLLAFHRSLSSSLSKWLHHSGLNMGHYLMPPAISNPEGHYEDMPLVALHDRLLRLHGTDWRFHDEASFDPCCRIDLLNRYIAQREAATAGPWGAKDPRACLFLSAWRQVLGERGRYLVLLRHWSGSVQSLYRRHSESLAMGEGSTDLHVSFWRTPEQAARMWLAYHQRILPLLEEGPQQCLVVTQQAILEGLPVIEKVNERFGLALDELTSSPIRHSLSHDRIEESIRERLTPSLRESLDAMWQRLLAYADHRAGNEQPQWVPDRDSDTEKVNELLTLAEAVSKSSVTESKSIATGLQEQLKHLAENAESYLNADDWEKRIEQEARFVPEAWEFLARAQLVRGDALGAEANLARVLLCGKHQPYLFLLLGTCREAELDDEGAEHFYRQAIARNPANANFYTRLANLWLAQGAYAKVERYLKETIHRYPDKPLLIHSLANCLDQQQMTADALALLEKHGATAENAPPLLANLWASLFLKQHPDQPCQHPPFINIAAIKPQAVTQLAQIDDSIVRRDLARRLVNTWVASAVLND